MVLKMKNFYYDFRDVTVEFRNCKNKTLLFLLDQMLEILVVASKVLSYCLIGDLRRDTIRGILDWILDIQTKWQEQDRTQGDLWLTKRYAILIFLVVAIIF